MAVRADGRIPLITRFHKQYFGAGGGVVKIVAPACAGMLKRIDKIFRKAFFLLISRFPQVPRIIFWLPVFNLTCRRVFPCNTKPSVYLRYKGISVKRPSSRSGTSRLVCQLQDEWLQINGSP